MKITDSSTAAGGVDEQLTTTDLVVPPGLRHGPSLGDLRQARIDSSRGLRSCPGGHLAWRDARVPGQGKFSPHIMQPTLSLV